MKELLEYIYSDPYVNKELLLQFYIGKQIIRAKVQTWDISFSEDEEEIEIDNGTVFFELSLKGYVCLNNNKEESCVLYNKEENSFLYFSFLY